MAILSILRTILLVGCATSVWSAPVVDSNVEPINKEDLTKYNFQLPPFLQGPRPTGPTAVGNANATGEVQGLFATNENSLFVMSGPNSNAIANLTSTAAYFAEPYNTTESDVEGGDTISQNMAGFTVTAQEDTQAYAEGEYIQFVNHGASYATGWGNSTADGQTYNPGPEQVAPAEPGSGWNAPPPSMGQPKPPAQDGKGNSNKPNQQPQSQSAPKPNNQNQQASAKPPVQDGKGNGRPNGKPVSQGNQNSQPQYSTSNESPNSQGYPTQQVFQPAQQSRPNGNFNHNQQPQQQQQSHSRPNSNSNQNQQPQQQSQSKPNGNPNNNQQPQQSHSRPNSNSNQSQQPQQSLSRPNSNSNQNQQPQQSASRPNSNGNQNQQSRPYNSNPSPVQQSQPSQSKPNQQSPSKPNPSQQAPSKPSPNNQGASKPNPNQPASKPSAQDNKGNAKPSPQSKPTSGKPQDGKGNKPNGKPQKPKTEGEEEDVYEVDV